MSSFLTIILGHRGENQVIVNPEPQFSTGSEGARFKTPPRDLRKVTVTANGGQPTIILEGQYLGKPIGDRATVILTVPEAVKVALGIAAFLDARGIDATAILEATQ